MPTLLVTVTKSLCNVWSWVVQSVNECSEERCRWQKPRRLMREEQRADFPRGKKKPGDKIGHSGAETRRVQHLRSPKKRYTMSKR